MGKIRLSGAMMVFSRELPPLSTESWDFEQRNSFASSSMSALFAAPSIGGAAILSRRILPWRGWGSQPITACCLALGVTRT